MHTQKRIFALGVAVFAATALATPASAQLANASAATLGLAGNQTAVARGFAAISVNPAGLAMPGSGFSLALLPVQVRAGLSPITLTDLKAVEGQVVDQATREDWVAQIDAAGGQSGALGADVSALALTFGSIGLQLSTTVGLNMTLGPNVVETVLFGNADPTTGTARDVTLEGSAFDAFGATTAAISFGKSLPNPTGSMAAGVTLKYTVGHFLTSGTASGSMTSNPIAIQAEMPTIVSCETVPSGTPGETDLDCPASAGSGYGLDLGFQMEQGPLHLGASVQNAINTFSWDVSKFSYVPGTVRFEAASDTTIFDGEPFANAPAELRAAVDDLTFKPTLAVGGAFDLPMALTVMADLRQRLGDGLGVQPKFNMGVGAEWRGLRIIHLRAGGAVVTGGVQYGGGASLVLGPLNLTVGAGTVTGDAADTGILQVGLSFGNR